MSRFLAWGPVLSFCIGLPLTASAQGATTPAVDPGSFNVHLRDVQARTDEMKEGIRRIHTALQAMAERHMGSAEASPVELSFRNEMSGAFRLRRALFVLDGVVQVNRADDDQLADDSRLPIFRGSLAAGDHTMQAVLSFQGSGQGVLTYLQAYTFEVKSSHWFTTHDGRPLTVTASAIEKGDVTTPFEQRPGLVWSERVGAPYSGSR
jgi:hypothetical protein